MNLNVIDQDFFNVIGNKFKEAIKTAEIVTKFISDEFIKNANRPMPPEIHKNYPHANRCNHKFYMTKDLERFIILETGTDITITDEVLAILTQTTNKYHMRFQTFYAHDSYEICIDASLPHVGHILQMAEDIDERKISDIFDVSGSYCW